MKEAERVRRCSKPGGGSHTHVSGALASEELVNQRWSLRESLPPAAWQALFEARA